MVARAIRHCDNRRPGSLRAAPCLGCRRIAQIEPARAQGGDGAARFTLPATPPHDMTVPMVMPPDRTSAEKSLLEIVVVGGGAAGLELVTLLGNRLGRRGRANVALVECTRAHLWKPLLHEVA